MLHSMEAHFQNRDDKYDILLEELDMNRDFDRLTRFDDEQFMQSEIQNEANYVTSAYYSEQRPHNAPYPSEYAHSHKVGPSTITPIFTKYNY